MDSKTDKAMVCDTPTDQSVAATDDKVEWDAGQEQRAKRKIDLTVLPLLVLGLLMFQLDRMNLASALTAGFAKDIDVSQDTVNLGNQLMFMGTVVLEIPCNLLLQRFGPRKWISLQVLLFGLVGTLQVLVKNRAGFLAIRLMLGFTEAGYIPASIFTLSTWYTKRELAKRVAIFMFGQFGGNGLSPLLASGILKMEGHLGLKGWQWLFLLEGLFTLAVALMFIFLLPGSPDTPKPIGSPGLVRFSRNQQEILQKRLEIDGQAVAALRLHVLRILDLVTIDDVYSFNHHVNCREAGERSIAIAMWVMSAISGLMVGSQYFRANDLPFYDRGLLTMIIMVSVGMAFALLQELVYFVHNRRVAQGKHKSKDGSEPYVYSY
ncbi:hypothetical protein K4K60_012519 [Colletotrichum sp. SAR11_57]|nr:hypothetical protein K4K60_012519 [Colletotrichum sp. SAR11_57]